MSTGREDSFWAPVRQRWAPVDALFLLLPLLLVALWGLPSGVRRDLMFSYARPTLLTAYVAHFVHLSWPHLLGNLVGYTVLASTAYLLSAKAGCLGRFRRSVLAVLVAVPFGISIANLAVPVATFGAGFSGVNTALLGLLTLSLGTYLSQYLGVRLDRLGATLFFLALAVVAGVGLPGSLRARLLATAAMLAAVLTVVTSRAVRRNRERWGRLGALELGVARLLLLGAVVGLQFRYDGGGSAAGLQFYVHVMGYVLAYVPAYVVAVLE